MIRLSIRRPVAATMIYLALALLGVASWLDIPLELLPDTELPRLTVSVDWPGASPETVEAFLTSPIEAEVQKVRGVERVTSESFHEEGRGVARVDVEFQHGTDMDFARLDLAERMATVEGSLPPGAGRVAVEAYVPPEFQDQQRPFMRYTFTGPHTDEALRQHLEDVVEPELARIEGVAVVRAYGGRDRVVEVELDETRINALGLSAVDVRRRVESLDLVREAGAVRVGDRERTVTIRNRPSSVQEIRDAVVTVNRGRLIRIADVATVRDTFGEAREHRRIDGRPGVQFTLAREIGANTVRVAAQVRDAVALLGRRTLPGARFILEQDQSEQIERQLSDLRYRALLAAGVIFLVLLAFLRSIRSAAVIFATIAFSVLIALTVLYLGGMTLNLLTLVGLAMGLGLIVDNAIVVLENVYRRWESGECAAVAADSGSRQVVLPILAATATTLIVFVPFVYLQGELRVFYLPLAVVVGLTLVASLFVAFSFIPAAAAALLGGREGQTIRRSRPAGHRERPSPPSYARLYAGVVTWTLHRAWAAAALAALAFAGSWWLFDRHVTRGVVWGGVWGQETYISIQIRLPRGSDLLRTDELARYVEERLARMPEVERYQSTVRGELAAIEVTFPEELENTDVPPRVKQRLVAHSLGYSGAEVRVYGFGPSFYGAGTSPPNYAFTILGYNYERVREIAEHVGARLRRLPRVSDVDTNASGNWLEADRAAEFVVQLRRDVLARYDLTPRDFIERMTAAIRGRTVNSTIKIRGEEVHFEVKLEDARRMDVRQLRETLITGPGGSLVRVGDLVRIERRELLSRIRREDQQYQRGIAYEFRGPRRLGDVYYDAVVAATDLPPGYAIERTDDERLSGEDRAQILMVLGVSLLLVYMVTGALFESLVQPFCVLLTVPTALIGVFLMFFLTGASFTREAYVGVITMGGIVVNNAILLVDHVNRVRRDTGLPLEQAVLRGTLERVRPILMTTATTVLGLMPLVLFSTTADANIWNALAFALMGGLLSSTVFVLTFTPALYLLFERARAGSSVAAAGSVFAVTEPA